MIGRSLSSEDRYLYTSSRSVSFIIIFKGDLKMVCMMKVEIIA